MNFKLYLAFGWFVVAINACSGFKRASLDTVNVNNPLKVRNLNSIDSIRVGLRFKKFLKPFVSTWFEDGHLRHFSSNDDLWLVQLDSDDSLSVIVPHSFSSGIEEGIFYKVDLYTFNSLTHYGCNFLRIDDLQNKIVRVDEENEDSVCTLDMVELFGRRWMFWQQIYLVKSIETI